MKNFLLHHEFKPVLVFFSGWGFETTIWQSVHNSLSHFIIDSVNFADLAENNFSIPIFVKKFLRHFQPSQEFILVGWSYGGLLALQFANCLGNRCKKIILVASNPKWVSSSNWSGISRQFADQFLLKAHSNLPGQLQHFLRLVQYPSRQKHLRPWLEKHLMSTDNKKDLLLSTLKMLMAADERLTYQFFSVPMLHILGEQDAIVPVRISNQLGQLNPRATIQIISGAGHVPFLTHSEIFMHYLTQFVNHEYGC